MGLHNCLKIILWVILGPGVTKDDNQRQYKIELGQLCLRLIPEMDPITSIQHPEEWIPGSTGLRRDFAQI